MYVSNLKFRPKILKKNGKIVLFSRSRTDFFLIISFVKNGSVELLHFRENAQYVSDFFSNIREHAMLAAVKTTKCRYEFSIIFVK